jgi:hypothetical protein
MKNFCWNERIKPMDIQKPELPFSLKVIGVVAKLMSALDLSPTRLDEDSVCKAAVKAAGLRVYLAG